MRDRRGTKKRKQEKNRRRGVGEGRDVEESGNHDGG